MARSRLGMVNGKQAGGGGHPSLTCVLRKSILQLSWTPKLWARVFGFVFGRIWAKDVSGRLTSLLAFRVLLRGVSSPCPGRPHSSPPTLNSCRLHLKGGVNAFPGREFSPTLEQPFALLPILAFSCLLFLKGRGGQYTERLKFRQILIQIFKQQPPTPQASFPES